MDYISLTWVDLALAACLIFINGGLSLALGLGLERTLFINTVRMVLQLAAIGFVLKFIFSQSGPWWTLGWALIMLSVAGYEILARQSYRVKGGKAYGLSVMTLFMVGFTCTAFALTVMIEPTPWYDPRYLLPILGMVFGNTMTGIALGMETLTLSLKQAQGEIEGRLMLGATRYEAATKQVRQAIKSGLMPIVNAMAASGIVALPGMMTGQIIAGVDPIDATKYQLMIMFIIAGGTALGTTGGVYGTLWLLTDERHRLRLERLND